MFTVDRIERIDEFSFQVCSDRHKEIREFKNPKECLEKFLEAKKEWRVYNGKTW